jgi:BirA family transcriptional regulator, biotin operon repressor / biotin---[acetyl-CoA-carboxylase] ligase
MPEAPFTPETVQDALSPRPARYFPQAGSTNDLALEWLQQGAPNGAVVIADEQIKGRGRMGRSWYAPPGTALMLSVVLRPSVAEMPRLPMMAAVAVCELLESIGLKEARIKWPNDVHLSGRKVCGVLPEAVWTGNTLAGAALGIGLNVRIDFTNTELAESATSIETALGHPVNRLELLQLLLGRIDRWTTRLSSPELFEAWRSRLTTLGQTVSISVADGVVRGVAEAVDDQGGLLVRDSSGRQRRVIAGDIALG